MRARVGVFAAVCLVFSLIAEPATAAPSRGAYYTATAPGAPRPSYVRVSADGTRLTTYLLLFEASCSDGKRRDFGLGEAGEKRFGLTTDGRFDFTSRTSRFAAGEGRNRIRGRGSVRVSGVIGADEATLNVEERFTAGSVTCNQTIPLTLRRVGSPALPANDSVMSTGRYRARAGRGLSVPAFSAVGPARLVNDLSVAWKVRRCARGGTNYRDAFPFVPLALTSRGTINLPVADRHRLGRALTVRIRGRLTLRFARGKGVGTWQATTGVYRGRRKVDTCRFRRHRFSFSASAQR